MPKDRRHAAIMFTDIVGYTAIMGSDEDKAFEILSKNREIHTQLLEKYGGTLIKEMGDGMLMSFTLASDAVYCAIEIQKKCKEQDIPLKIGIHEGEMVFEGIDIIGDAVNVASRLEADTQQGCIYISGSVYRDIKNRSDIQTKYIKDKKFKNVDEPIKVYEVLCEENGDLSISNKNSHGQIINRKSVIFIIGFLAVIGAGFIVWNLIPTSTTDELDKSIAVLPFWNESSDSTNVYFVNGMMEDIRNNLSKISDLRVISRTTMEKYRETKLTASEIAKEVGVSYLLEGSVQKLGSQVKVHAQLINAGIDDHTWQDTYTEDISDIEQVFEIQNDIAKTIAKQIGANIKSNEGEHIEAIPTSSPLAYDYYLQGKEIMYSNRFGLDNINVAIKMYEQAVALDSSFALAWVGLAESNRWLYWGDTRFLSVDKEDYAKKVQQISKTKKYLDKAIGIAPDFKEIRIEEGAYYFQCERNYTKALQILDKLSVDYPRDAEILFWIFAIRRRKGEFEKSFEYINKAISLNPSYWVYWIEAGYTLEILRKYDEAEKYLKKAISLHPSTNWYNQLLFDFYMDTGEYKKAMQFLNKHAQLLPENLVNFYIASIYFHEGDFAQSINLLEDISYDSADWQASITYVYLGIAYEKSSNEKKAVKNFNKAKEMLELNIAKGVKHIDIYRFYALSLAGLGLKEQAIEANKKVLEIQSYASEDALDAVVVYYDKARILVMVGEYDEAIKTLTYLLNHCGGLLSIQDLRNFPMWEPLREMEEFKAIINNPEYQPK